VASPVVEVLTAASCGVGAGVAAADKENEPPWVLENFEGAWLVTHWSQKDREGWTPPVRFGPTFFVGGRLICGNTHL
jgi:hypothetical protein